jgi:hypothetical protein
MLIRYIQASIVPRHYPGWCRAVTRQALLWGNLAAPTGALQVPGCAPRGGAAGTETRPAGERSPGGHSPTALVAPWQGLCNRCADHRDVGIRIGYRHASV